MDYTNHERDNFKFHCPRDGELVTLSNDCMDCPHNYGCDIYASMLDEQEHY